MLDYITTPGLLSDDAVFYDQELIACKSCHRVAHEGMCIYAQYIGQKTVTGLEVKQALQRLLNAGCESHGSAPLYPGDNVYDGELTYNWKRNGCIKHGNKICQSG